MFPRLFQIGQFSLPTYGLLVATGVIVGLFVTQAMARRQGIDPEKAWNLGIYAVISALVGAKVLMILNDLGRYHSWHDVFSMEVLQAGGVFSGGFVTALVVSFWYIRKNHLPVLRTCDAFAPGLALGHAIGRIGCFAAGCCYGKPTTLPWGVTFHNQWAALMTGVPLGHPLHPTQLYESAVELINFFILFWLIRHKKFDGQIIGAYMFIYGFARYFMEFLRDDPERGSLFNNAMSVTQLLSIFLVIGGGILWLRWRSAPKTAMAGAR